MTYKRLRKLLQATGIQRNNVEDVIRKYREDYFIQQMKVFTIAIVSVNC